jgi:hypothetical protein
MNRREFVAGLMAAAEVTDVRTSLGAPPQSLDNVPNGTDEAWFDRAVWRSPYAGTRVF